MLNLGFLDLLVPVIVQVIALIYLPITLFILVKNREFPTLRSWTAFQQAWFARFWMFFGRASRPLFAADVEHVLSRARGVVLDLGTGSGDWAYMFATARNQHITKILFLEPNTQFHPKLRKMAQSVGLDGRYEILGGGVEELDHRGVKKGTVDTVVTVHVLCSVSSPEPLVKELYEYLRPGGQWLVYEHVKVREGDSVASTCQGEWFCSRMKNDVLIGLFLARHYRYDQLRLAYPLRWLLVDPGHQAFTSTDGEMAGGRSRAWFERGAIQYAATYPGGFDEGRVTGFYNDFRS